MTNDNTKAEATVVIEGESSAVTTVGLLGAVVDRDKFDLIGPRYITDCRLAEIERRILAIEGMVWPLGR